MNAYQETLDHINGALDALGELPVESHGRETGQVEYKLNEAKLWFSVVPNAINSLNAPGTTPEPLPATTTPDPAAPEPAPSPASEPNAVPGSGEPAPAAADAPNTSAGSGETLAPVGTSQEGADDSTEPTKPEPTADVSAT